MWVAFSDKHLHNMLSWCFYKEKLTISLTLIHLQGQRGKTGV